MIALQTLVLRIIYKCFNNKNFYLSLEPLCLCIVYVTGRVRFLHTGLVCDKHLQMILPIHKNVLP